KGRTAAEVVATLCAAANRWDETTELAAELDALNAEAVHADYPHHPGTLYGCPTCEAVCLCDEFFQCVHCAIIAEAADQDESTPTAILPCGCPDDLSEDLGHRGCPALGGDH